MHLLYVAEWEAWRRASVFPTHCYFSLLSVQLPYIPGSMRGATLSQKWLLHTCGERAPFNHRHRGDAPALVSPEWEAECPAILTVCNRRPACVNCVCLPPHSDIYTVVIKGKYICFYCSDITFLCALPPVVFLYRDSLGPEVAHRRRSLEIILEGI